MSSIHHKSATLRAALPPAFHYPLYTLPFTEHERSVKKGNQAYVRQNGSFHSA
jgi:hypothetical protein